MNSKWSEDPAGEDMLAFETLAAEAGFSRIAGVDEAGRGPLAGPIVAGAVVLSGPIEGLTDSKLLTESKRDAYYKELTEGPHAVGVHVVAQGIIDEHGIQRANYMAMAGAVEGLAPAPDFLLVDGFEIRGCAIPQKSIVKGDRRSFSIAAASVIAKVTRDRIMKELDAEFPGYGFAQHKGYGTRAHLEALERLGPCPAHRRSFAPISQGVETAALFEQEVPRP